MRLEKLAGYNIQSKENSITLIFQPVARNLDEKYSANTFPLISMLFPFPAAVSSIYIEGDNCIKDATSIETSGLRAFTKNNFDLTD